MEVSDPNGAGALCSGGREAATETHAGDDGGGGGGGGGGGDDGGGDDGGDYDHHVWDVAIYLFWIFNCAVHAHVEAPFKKSSNGHLTID